MYKGICDSLKKKETWLIESNKAYGNLLGVAQYSIIVLFDSRNKRIQKKQADLKNVLFFLKY